MVGRTSWGRVASVRYQVIEPKVRSICKFPACEDKNHTWLYICGNAEKGKVARDSRMLKRGTLQKAHERREVYDSSST